MKTLFSIIFSLAILFCLGFTSNAQNVNIPDANFKAYLVGNSSINTNLDAEIQLSEASAFSGSIDIRGLGITDLSGIESFVSLTYLNCGDNSISSLNVSSNTALTNLLCYSNSLTSLDVSSNPVLVELNVSNNSLTSLDISSNPSLTNLNLSGNSLNSLDLNSNVALTNLNCATNSLSNLDVSLNTALISLYCDNNGITSLDISDNTSLESLSCPGNAIASLDVSNNTDLEFINCSQNLLTNLDVSNNTNLRMLYCWNNSLGELDLSNNADLYYLLCKNNLLSNLDLSSNTGLYNLDCSNNDLQGIDLSQCSALSTLNCSNNSLTNLDLSANVALTSIDCNSNLLGSLDLKNNIVLSSLSCNNNLLSNLDIRNGNNSNIGDFDASNNLNLSCVSVSDVAYASANWTTIDVGVTFNPDCGVLPVYIPDPNFKAALVADASINSNSDGQIQNSEAWVFSGAIDVNNQGISDLTGLEAFISLTELHCYSNSLTSLDVTANTALSILDFRFNNVSGPVDVSNNMALTKLDCNENPLGSLDISNNIALEILGCKSTSLTSLDVSNNPALQVLWCPSNSLANLDLSSNPALEHLSFEDNSLSNIDLSSNPSLLSLHASYNNLSSLDLSANSALEYLNCSYNNLSSLDLSSNPLLTFISCVDNNLTSLDVGSHTLIEQLYCGANSITTLDISLSTALQELDFSGNLLTDLDVSNNAALIYLDGGSNNLSSLDLSANTLLTTLDLGSNNLPTIDVSANTALTELGLESNSLTALDVSANPALEFLDCSSNSITTLDLSACMVLRELNCSSNSLEILDLRNGNNSNLGNDVDTRNNPELICITVSDAAFATANWTDIDAWTSFSVDCAVYIPDANFKAALVANTAINTNSDSEIQFNEAAAFTGTIDVSGLGISDLTGIEAFTRLTELNCGSNALSVLNIDFNTALTSLRCDNNSLTNLDISNQTALSKLYCYANLLTSLDVSSNTGLTTLDCFQNNLTSLDVSSNTALTKLSCQDNSISSVDVSANTALTELDCGRNAIGSLDVSNNILLTYLGCGGNSLSTLDLSSNPNLVTLNAWGNSLSSIEVSDKPDLDWLDVSSNALTRLDVSSNSVLTALFCDNNSLIELDVRNGNNTSFGEFHASGNPDLTCISVSDVAYAQANWTDVDAGANFNANCRFQEITFAVPTSKTYGDADFDLGATSSSGLLVSFSSSDESVATVSGATVTIVGAGTTTITASQAGGVIYDAANDVMHDLIVEKASLTASAVDQSKTYGAVNPDLSITYAGFVNSDDKSDLTTEPIAICTATQSNAVGTYAITVTGGADNNYDFTYVDGQLSINRATLIAKAANQIKAYGAANPTLTVDYSGFVNGDDEIMLDAAPIASSLADESSPVGTYEISIVGGSDSNYDISNINGTLTVEPALLTVTAIDQTIHYGDPIPALSMSYAGFVNGEDESVIDTAPIISTTADESSQAGTYTISITGGSDDNYNFEYVTAKVRIQRASQTITFDRIGEVLLEEGSLELSATSSSGLEIEYDLIAGPAELDGSTISFTGLGTVHVAASQNGNMNYLAAARVQQAFEITEITGLEEIANRVTVYPIPVVDFLSIELGNTEIESVRLLQVDGKAVRVFDQKDRVLDLRGIKHGVYILSIATPGEVLNKRIVKQ